ncbi:MAG: SPOR domain-containing protein [Tannerellaceae bacterium]|jgi:cell division protein FtsN|nr:SPOR domain-containing protein [Tannerellaceae bacterium]
MNKIWLFGTAMCMVLAFVSCKPKQSAYKAAYEQAKEREANDPVEVFDDEEDFADADEVDEFEIAPVSKPKTSSESVATRQEEFPVYQENVTTRQEVINPYQGEATGVLKRYSVVIGSFRNKTNAYALKERMQYEGYSAMLGENGQGMLRVIVTSFDNKMDAVRSRDAFRSKYYPNFQDAWILERYY